MLWFIEYNETTGVINSCLFSDENFYNQRVIDGATTLVVSQKIDINNNVVNTTTTPPMVVARTTVETFQPATPVTTIPTATMTAPTKVQLTSLVNAILASYATGGISVNIGTVTAPIMALVDVSADGKSNVLGLYKDFADGSTGEIWYQSTGNLTITREQLDIISGALKNYVQGSLSVWQSAVAAINESPPTITTFAQVKALAWPAVAQD